MNRRDETIRRSTLAVAGFFVFGGLASFVVLALFTVGVLDCGDILAGARWSALAGACAALAGVVVPERARREVGGESPRDDRTCTHVYYGAPDDATAADDLPEE